MSERCGIIGCPNEDWRSIEVEMETGSMWRIFDVKEKLLLCRDHFKLIRGSLDRVGFRR